ncbi:Conserved protein of uncharacterised function with PIN domain%2C possible toxin VapC8 [Mycobacterium tuberculosis]|nr:Conserved protein of uncharacterised function with PIN domain%2C possible toxin VapC8 [Mycobacterium tuberculosis]
MRDLRNRTSQVVDAVKAGVPVTLTVHGEPVADIVPHRRRIRWLSGRICAMSSPSARPTRASPMNSTTWPVIPSTTCDRGRGRGRPARYAVFIARESGGAIADLPERVALSVMTIGELQLGLLNAGDSATRSRRADTLALARTADQIPVSEAVMISLARLVADCRAAGVRRSVKLTDALIAATAEIKV